MRSNPEPKPESMRSKRNGRSPEPQRSRPEPKPEPVRSKPEPKPESMRSKRNGRSPEPQRSNPESKPESMRSKRIGTFPELRPEPMLIQSCIDAIESNTPH